MPKKKIKGKFLTFGDVLLIPKRSPVDSRKDIDLSTNIGPFRINLPIISSPMDTVTESSMAIAMAKNGGLGIIHRFCSIEDQKNEVEKVKRKENWIIENPITVSPETTLAEILSLVEKYGFWTYLVVDENKKLLGLISKRDYLFCDDKNKKVKDLMVPFEKLIVINKKISLEEAKKIFEKYKIEKLPIVDKERKVLGLITSKDVENFSNKKTSRDSKGRLLVGAAIGIKGDFLERAQELVRVGVDILVVDVAHGHLEKTLKAVKTLKSKFPEIPLIAGNVATPEGVRDLFSAGADVVKVGIGPGSSCSTRIVTGVGVPQLGALLWIKERYPKIPIISDGGCKNSGDIVKALAAGAHAVMLGNMLAGTDEAPGKVMVVNGKRVKVFRGMSSSFAYERKLKETNEKAEYIPVSEGAEFGLVPYKGSVSEVLENIEKGLRSGFSYCGARNLKELWKKAEFVEISLGGLKESGFDNIFLV